MRFAIQCQIMRGNKSRRQDHCYGKLELKEQSGSDFHLTLRCQVVEFEPFLYISECKRPNLLVFFSLLPLFLYIQQGERQFIPWKKKKKRSLYLLVKTVAFSISVFHSFSLSRSLCGQTCYDFTNLIFHIWQRALGLLYFINVLL